MTQKTRGANFVTSSAKIAKINCKLRSTEQTAAIFKEKKKKKNEESKIVNTTTNYGNVNTSSTNNKNKTTPIPFPRLVSIRLVVMHRRC